MFSKGIGQFTQANRQRIIDAIRVGNYPRIAAEAGGISHATLQKWLKQGERDKHGEFHDFYVACRQAEAQAEQDVLAIWHDQFASDWRAAATFLARRFRDRWGPPQPNEAPADVKVVITGGSKDKSANTPQTPEDGG